VRRGRAPTPSTWTQAASSTRDSCTPRNSPPARNTGILTITTIIVLSQANGINSEKKNKIKNRMLEARIETKMLISPFRDITKIRIAFSYVVSSKVFGKTKVFAKICKQSFLQVMVKTKKFAKMAPNFNFSVLNSHF
jgi:hypothetical protein